MFISVRFLYEWGKRLSDYQVKVRAPLVGWLYVDPQNYASRPGLCVRLAREDGDGPDLARLEHAEIREGLGPRGMLITGIHYRKKGSKHSIPDQQAWWCHAPPRPDPLLDVQARQRAAWERYQRDQLLAGAGEDNESRSP